MWNPLERSHSPPSNSWKGGSSRKMHHLPPKALTGSPERAARPKSPGALRVCSPPLTSGPTPAIWPRPLRPPVGPPQDAQEAPAPAPAAPLLHTSGVPYAPPAGKEDGSGSAHSPRCQSSGSQLGRVFLPPRLGVTHVFSPAATSLALPGAAEGCMLGSPVGGPPQHPLLPTALPLPPRHEEAQTPGRVSLAHTRPPETAELDKGPAGRGTG